MTAYVLGGATRGATAECYRQGDGRIQFFLKQEMLKLQSLLVLMTAETCRDAKTRRTRQKKILNQKNRIRCLLSQIAGPDPRIV